MKIKQERRTILTSALICLRRFHCASTLTNVSFRLSSVSHWNLRHMNLAIVNRQVSLQNGI